MRRPNPLAAITAAIALAMAACGTASTDPVAEAAGTLTATAESSSTSAPDSTTTSSTTAPPATELPIPFEPDREMYEERIELFSGSAESAIGRWVPLENGTGIWGASTEDGSVVAYQADIDGNITAVAVLSRDLTIVPSRLLAITITNAAGDGDQIDEWIDEYAEIIAPQLGRLQMGTTKFVAVPHFELYVVVDTDLGGILFVAQPYESPPVDLEPFRELVTLR